MTTRIERNITSNTPLKVNDGNIIFKSNIKSNNRNIESSQLLATSHMIYYDLFRLQKPHQASYLLYGSIPLPLQESHSLYPLPLQYPHSFEESLISFLLPPHTGQGILPFPSQNIHLAILIVSL